MKISSFSKRESDVSDLLLQGLNNEEIAKELSLKNSTVRFYIMQIFKKSGVKTREKYIVQQSGMEKK